MPSTKDRAPLRCFSAGSQSGLPWQPCAALSHPGESRLGDHLPQILVEKNTLSPAALEPRPGLILL
eukprot:9334003-Pyramimonas_sp.AAC.1